MAHASPRQIPARARIPAAALLAGLTAAGCGLQISHQAEARDEWKRSYEVKPGAELEIRNPNGRIRVEAADVKQIEVSAVRIVRGSTDEAAKAALAEFTIAESPSADRVLIDAASRGTGFMLGLSRSVEFEVKVPRGVNVVLDTSNGEITAARLAGAFRATATNGSITATDIDGSARLETTNGRIHLDMARIADPGVTCETTNGVVVVTIPREAGARISARVSNGNIDTSNLDLKVTDQSRRRLEATVGSGGPTVRIETTNGMVSVRGR